MSAWQFPAWNSAELVDVTPTGGPALPANIRRDVIRGISIFAFFFSCPHKRRHAFLLFSFTYGTTAVFQFILFKCILSVSLSSIHFSTCSTRNERNRGTFQDVYICGLKAFNLEVLVLFTFSFLVSGSVWPMRRLQVALLHQIDSSVLSSPGRFYRDLFVVLSVSSVWALNCPFSWAEHLMLSLLQYLNENMQSPLQNFPLVLHVHLSLGCLPSSPHDCVGLGALVSYLVIGCRHLFLCVFSLKAHRTSIIIFHGLRL